MSGKPKLKRRQPKLSVATRTYLYLRSKKKRLMRIAARDA